MKNTMPSISWWDNVIKDDLNMVNAVDSRCFFFFFFFFLPLFSFGWDGKTNNKGTLNFN